MFTDEIGRHLTSFHVSRRLSKLLHLVGLPPMRYHDLRHGAASLMAAQGVSARTAMEILEVWPESHWPGFALCQADVFQSYTAWQCMQYVSITNCYIDNRR